MIRVGLVTLGLLVGLVTGTLLVARQGEPPLLIAFLSNRDGTPAMYRMTANGTFVQSHFRYHEPICSLTGGPDQFVVLTVPAHQSRFPYCNALFFETHLLTPDGLRDMLHIGTSERGSLDPQGTAYIQDTWLADAFSNHIILRQDNLRVLMHCPSPLDDRVAFVGRQGGRYDLYMYDGDAVYPITEFRVNSLRLVCPAWSPDGRWLVLMVNNSDLWLIASDGSEQRQLRDDVRDTRTGMAWSADGQWLAFVGRVIHTALHVVRVSDGVAWEVDVRVPALSGLMWAENELIYDGADDQLHAYVPPTGPRRTITHLGANVYPAPLTMPTRPLRAGRLAMLAAAALLGGLVVGGYRASQ